MTNKGIYFLHSERFSVWQDKKKFLTEENIRDICDKNNWTKISLEEVRKKDYFLMPALYDFKDEEPQRSSKEIKQEIQSLAKETKETYEKILSEWAEIKVLLDNLEKDPEFYSTKINKE